MITAYSTHCGIHYLLILFAIARYNYYWPLIASTASHHVAFYEFLTHLGQSMWAERDRSWKRSGANRKWVSGSGARSGRLSNESGTVSVLRFRNALRSIFDPNRGVTLGGTDPLTFCNHLVPKYYKSKTRRLPEVYSESMQDCFVVSSSQNVYKLTSEQSVFAHDCHGTAATALIIIIILFESSNMAYTQTHKDIQTDRQNK